LEKEAARGIKQRKLVRRMVPGGEKESPDSDKKGPIFFGGEGDESGGDWDEKPDFP